MKWWMVNGSWLATVVWWSFAALMIVASAWYAMDDTPRYDPEENVPETQEDFYP